MEKLLEGDAEVRRYKDKVYEASPVIGAADQMYCNELYKDSALPGKMKRLVGIAVAVGTGSDSCLVNQTKCAVELGATKEEIMEVVSVAIVMGGKAALAYSARVVKVLEELGKW
jgi:AhpD family alkylhydroperoxidase